jgi:hypothetical protein
VAEVEVLSGYLLKVTEKDNENLSQDSLLPGCNSNRTPFEYTSIRRAITLVNLRVYSIELVKKRLGTRNYPLSLLYFNACFRFELLSEMLLIFSPLNSRIYNANSLPNTCKV